MYVEVFNRYTMSKEPEKHLDIKSLETTENGDILVTYFDGSSHLLDETLYLQAQSSSGRIYE